jgi:hypothetical protein
MMTKNRDTRRLGSRKQRAGKQPIFGIGIFTKNIILLNKVGNIFNFFNLIFIIILLSEFAQ